MNKRILEIIRGCYDMHVHTSPSHFDRLFDDFELAKELDKYEFSGAVIKTHFGSTSARAIIANKYAGAHAKLYGSVTLDYPVGGLNPYAVHSELLLGARVIWMPTFHAMADKAATNHIDRKVNAPGISLLKGDKLVKEIIPIFELAKTFNAVIATGHLSAGESYALCKAGNDYGVRMLVTHPDGILGYMPLELQVDLASKGVFIEKCWLNIHEAPNKKEDIISGIRKIGVKQCVLSTDFGHVRYYSPVDGMVDFAEALIKRGYTTEEIRQMGRENPKYLLMT